MDAYPVIETRSDPDLGLVFKIWSDPDTHPVKTQPKPQPNIAKNRPRKWPPKSQIWFHFPKNPAWIRFVIKTETILQTNLFPN